jgi:hypothetical protein
MSCSESTTPPLVSAGPPASVLVVSGDNQIDTVGTELPDALVARVVDDHSIPVKGQIVNFVVTSGGGSVFAGSAITNDSGIVQERWTLGTVAGQPQTIEARAVDNVTGAPLVFGTSTRRRWPQRLRRFSQRGAQQAGTPVPSRRRHRR